MFGNTENVLKFMPTGGINENNMLDYLAFDKILCCGGSWMVPKDAVAAKDWQRITDLTRSAVDKMLGFEVRHIGLNCPDAESSMETAKKIAALMGWINSWINIIGSRKNARNGFPLSELI